MVKSPYNIHSNKKIIPGFISKPEQGSKSVEFSKLIHRDLTEDNNVLSIYICPNRRNQADQAEKNFKTYNEYYLNDEHQIDVLHGEKQTSMDSDGYIHRAKEKGMRMIISICNKKRLNLILTIIIEWINNNYSNKIKIYLDEAGDPKTFNLFIRVIWSQLEDSIKDNLNKVFPIFIDAQSKGLLNIPNFKKYFPINGGTIHKLENSQNLENYMFMSSMTFFPNDWTDTNDILEYIHNNPNTIKYNDYILWPSPKVKKDQYNDAEEISFSLPNACILIINGEGFHIYTNDNPKITLPKNKCAKNRNCNYITCSKCHRFLQDEFSKIKVIKQKYSTNKPFIILGHDCIDRAMTYQDHSLSFTKLFISRINLLKDNFNNQSEKHFDELSVFKQEKVSQMVKRVCGSFLNILIDKKTPLPEIYGPKDIYYGICKLENISTYIANQSGYLTKSLRNEMDNGEMMLCEHQLYNKEEINNLDKQNEPNEYYFKKIPHNDDLIILKKDLTLFRKNIGGVVIREDGLKKRLDNGEESDMGKLSITQFRDDINILKKALFGKDSSSKSRFRICYDEFQNICWIIHFMVDRGKFKWDDNIYDIINIIPDGNCLFNCFIQYNLTEYDMEHFRYEVADELLNHKDLYDISNSYNKMDWCKKCDLVKKYYEWNEDIYDYVPLAISNILNVNIIIFNFDRLTNGGYEVINDIPTYIPHDKSKSNTIYLRKLNGNHYDLMKLV